MSGQKRADQAIANAVEESAEVLAAGLQDAGGSVRDGLSCLADSIWNAVREVARAIDGHAEAVRATQQERSGRKSATSGNGRNTRQTSFAGETQSGA